MNLVGSITRLSIHHSRTTGKARDQSRNRGSIVYIRRRLQWGSLLLRRKAVIKWKRIAAVGRLFGGGIIVVSDFVGSFIAIWKALVTIRNRVMSVDEVIGRIMRILVARRSAIPSI